MHAAMAFARTDAIDAADLVSGFARTHPKLVNLHSICITHLLQTRNTGQELAQKQLGSAHWEQQRRAK